MLPERKRKAAKKRGYDVRTDSRLRHNNSTRSIPAHIRSYDNNGRSGAVTPSNTEPQQKTRLQVIHYIGTRNGHSKGSDQYDRTPIFFAKTIEMSYISIPNPNTCGRTVEAVVNISTEVPAIRSRKHGRRDRFSACTHVQPLPAPNKSKRTCTENPIFRFSTLYSAKNR